MNFSDAKDKKCEYQASKWWKLQVFFSLDALDFFFQDLGSFWICPLGKVLQEEEQILEKDQYLQAYKKKVDQYLTHHITPIEEISPCAFTVLKEDLYLMNLSQNRFLLKIKNPVVQVHPYFFRFSKQNRSFLSNVYAEDSIFWGLQFSFPQIFQDEDLNLHKVHPQTFANAALFQKMRRWIRKHTSPISFEFEGEKIVTSMRASPQLFCLLQKYPKLIELGLNIGMLKKEVSDVD